MSFEIKNLNDLFEKYENDLNEIPSLPKISSLASTSNIPSSVNTNIENLLSEIKIKEKIHRLNKLENKNKTIASKTQKLPKITQFFYKKFNTDPDDMPINQSKNIIPNIITKEALLKVPSVCYSEDRYLQNMYGS